MPPHLWFGGKRIRRGRVAGLFYAASVKPSNPGELRGPTFQFNPGGSLNITNGTLRDIMETAYGVREFQILGGPSWLNSERYDIVAKTEPGDESNSVPETRLKLQTLLVQRFQLHVHRETRDLPIYALVIGKSGLKLIEGTAPIPDGSPAGIRTGCGQITGTVTSMANLAVYLERQLRRPVRDHTALSGRYNFQLDWTPDSGLCSAAESDAPSIFTAIEEKLGLKLESTKGPVEIIIVDRAEKAGEN